MKTERSRRGAVRLALALVSLAGLAAAGGCGGGGGGGPSHASSISTGGGSTLDRAREQALIEAHAINLRPTDLPRLRISSHEQVVDEKHAEDQVARCLGISQHGREVVRVMSPSFGEPKRERIVSTVGVALSRRLGVAAQAERDRRDLARAGSQRALDCNARYIGRSAAERGAAGVDVRALPSPLKGAGGVTMRFRTSFELPNPHGVGKPVKVRIYQDVLFDELGDKQIELSSSRVGAPVPTAVQRFLWAHLLARARSTAS
jgi:hypothetical protein